MLMWKGEREILWPLST